MLNNNTKNAIAYIAVVLIIFLVPIYTILANNSVITDGKEYKFKITFYDPYDMLRGNYLQFAFEESTAKIVDNSEISDGNDFYALISENEHGYAYFSGVTKTKPETENYYKTKGSIFYDNISVILDTPTRYYMNEKKASSADKIFRENIQDSYVIVKVKSGKMVITGVYINGQLIDDLVDKY